MGTPHERIDFMRLIEQAQDLADFEEAVVAAVRALPADVASILDFLEIPGGGAFDVPPEQAISYFKAKGLKPTFSYADMLDHQHDSGFTIAKMMDVDLLGQVRASLDSAMANGTPFKEWSDTITPILQSGGWWGRKQVVDPLTGQEIVAQLGSPWRLETIFRTNMQTAYAAGAWQEIEAQAELAPFLMYDSIDDFRTRPLHASWDKKVLPVSSHWWNAHYPPNGYNCFLPHTPIAGAIVAASKARYSGDAVEIETELGARLSVTPNHPIATPHGWIAAGQLREGDHVLSDSREIELVGAPRAPYVAGGAVADQQCPARADDLFEAIASHGRRSAQVTPLDFHGDAAGFDGQIDVVLVGDDRLMGDDLAARSDGGRKATLASRDANLPTEPCASVLPQLGVGLGAAASGDVGSSYLARPGLLAHLSPLRALRIGLAAQHYPAASEASGDGITAYAEFARQLVDRSAGHVAPDKIVRISRFPFSGHVFDVQTLSGAVAAGGIVAHNCRCGVIQLSADEVSAMGLKVQRDPPDDGTYKWTNPRTGDVHYIPSGLDPGFEHNAGKSWSWKSDELLQEKIKALPPSLSEAAKKALAEAEAKKVIDDLTSAATRAQQKAAAAQGKAALERAKALAEEKAAQWAAQQQLDAIAKGKETAGAGAAYKVKALADLQKSNAWFEAKPSEQLQQVLDKAAELKLKADLSKGLSTYKKAILDGKNPPPAAVKAFKSLDPADADAFIAKVDAEKAAIQKAAADAAAKAAADAAAQAQDLAPPKTSFVDTQAPDPDTMVVIGRKSKGGTPGALYQDTSTGQKWLVKFNGSDDAVRNEVLASKLYNLAGVEAPDLHAITIDGKPALASRIVDGITEVPARVLASTPSVTDGFAVDAWLANWDVAGLNFDNVVLVRGRAMRIDVGGSLRYRAVGGLKGSAFGKQVDEIESLRDGTNAQARQVFGGMSSADVERSVEKVLSLADADIRAVVLRYGPPDAAEREALADLMIARKRDLERRFPAAAERVRARLGSADAAPSQAAARVTAAEQQAVEASRVNGYAFSTDSDQVEDHQVIVHALKRANGDEATRGFFKLLPGASKELQKTIAATSQATAPSVDVASARDAVLSAVKSINFRADKGQAFDGKVVEKVKSALTHVDKLLAELSAMKTGAVKQQTLDFVQTEFKAWRDALAQSLPEIEKLGPAKKVTKMFPAGQLPDRVDFHAPPSAVQAGGVIWRRVNGTYAFDTATFERSFATENGGKATVSGAQLRYETTLADGTTVVYFPHDTGVAWAMQGIVKIDVPGRGVGSTTRVFGAMNEVGLKSVRATEVDRQHLYLNAYARIALLRKGNALKTFEAITDRTEAGVQAKLGMLKAATGLDIEASEGWRQIDGVRQAFGHGRAYQLRPDLDGADMRELDATHVLFHNPQGLSTNAGSGVFERLKGVIDGGGTFASLTDRVRRGVPLSGSSVESDLASGGGDFHFTRIRSRADQAGSTGVYWKTSALRRMDAITYQGDMFGRTTGDTVENNRRGQDVASFRSVAHGSSNETIFKGGMSIFDELDRIVLSSKAEVDEAIKWMQARGYKTWPDGRTLAEVIITKDKHRAKP